VTNGIAVRMSLLYLMLGGDKGRSVSLPEPAAAATVGERELEEAARA